MQIEVFWISQQIVHYFLHLIFPGIVAHVFFREYRMKAWLLMLSTMLIDIDHLWANPIFDPNRCSVGFHTFHSYPAIAMYLLLLTVPNKTIRIIGLGLTLHILTDLQDCLWQLAYSTH
jgi:hypothetical protein